MLAIRSFEQKAQAVLQARVPSDLRKSCVDRYEESVGYGQPTIEINCISLIGLMLNQVKI